MLAHVMLLWCRRAGCDILGKHSGLLQAPSAQHALWQKHRLAAVTASTSLTKALHTSHSPEADTRDSILIWVNGDTDLSRGFFG